MNTATRIAGIAAGLTMAIGSIGVASVASADPATSSKPTACSQQQKQLDKAEDALARVTAVFAKKEAKVEKASKASEKASKGQARAKAQHELRDAKAALKATKTTKKAQVQRVAKAQARLDACTAAQPSA